MNPERIPFIIYERGDPGSRQASERCSALIELRSNWNFKWGAVGCVKFVPASLLKLLRIFRPRVAFSYVGGGL